MVIGVYVNRNLRIRFPILSVWKLPVNTSADGNALHVCTAKANYGGIEVDWTSRQVSMAIYTPHETDTIAGRIVIPL